MKKIVIELDLETGKMTVDAIGFQGNTCDLVLKEIEKDMEEKTEIRKTPSKVEKSVDKEVDVEVIY